MIVILVLILIVIGINLLIVWLRINEGRKIAANLKVFEHKNPNARLKVLFIGDSTAVDSGSKSPEESFAGRFFKDYLNSDGYYLWYKKFKKTLKEKNIKL